MDVILQVHQYSFFFYHFHIDTLFQTHIHIFQSKWIRDMYGIYQAGQIKVNNAGRHFFAIYFLCSIFFAFNFFFVCIKSVKHKAVENIYRNERCKK